MQSRSGERLDGRRQCCREKQRLPVGGQFRQNAPDVRQEAHIEHPIGLVENEHFNTRQIDRISIEMVDQPARRRNDDGHAAAQLPDLPIDILAADEGGGANTALRIETAQVRRNLSGELSRRCDDQRADPVSGNSRNSIKQGGRKRRFCRCRLRRNRSDQRR